MNEIDPIKLKLNFLKRVLTDSVNNETVYTEFFKTKEYPSESVMKTVVESPLDSKRLEGLDHPIRGHTMIGIKRLTNVENSLDYIRTNNIDGDIIETGVWRGGCCIFMQLYLALYQMSKNVFVADSFEGLPRPDIARYPQDSGDVHYTYENLKISLEEVKNNFIAYNALGDNVFFLKGWFKDTLTNNEQIQKLSLLRLDGDMYGSTMDVLTSLYPKLTDKGVIIVDDYCLGGCKLAIHDFKTSQNITDQHTQVDQCGIWWIKNT